MAQRSSLLLIVSSLIIASCLSANAQSATQEAKETAGLFTVRFPADWRVIEIPQDKIASTFPVPAGASPDVFKAFMYAKAPDDDPGTFVIIMVMSLQRRVSAFDLWLTSGQTFAKNFRGYKSLDEGIGKVGEREVYYNKFTFQADPNSQGLNYGIVNVLVSGMISYFVLATTPNDPEGIRKHTPIFEDIVATLNPTPTP